MSKPRILVIEDDEAIRRLVQTTLEKHGHEVHSAVDGLAGLAALESVQPDLVVLDITMPRMDGWEVLAKLRAMEPFALTPVILLTALGSPDHRAEGLRLGADDYMTKPFRIAELELRVARALRQRAQFVYFSKGLARAAASVGPGDVHGSLAEFGPVSVLCLLFDEHKTGVASFQVDQKLIARVTVRDGLIVAVEGAGDTVETALQALALQTSGTFAFQSLAEVNGGPGDPGTRAWLDELRRPLEAEPLESVRPPQV